MSDGTYLPPPPPPPPPPPAPVPTPSATFDFVRPFAFYFEDPRWVNKTLIGGLFVLASFLIVGVFFLMGYIAKLARNVIAGVQYPLPEWDDLGEMFAEGLRLFVVGLVYMLPIVAIFFVMIVPIIVASASGNETAQQLSGGLAACAWCIIFPLSLALACFMPGALIRAIAERRIGAAFEVGAVWNFIVANIGNYLLAIVVHLVVNMVGQFGILLCFIGVIFTSFWGMCVYSYAFAEVYRLAKVR